jgi:isochorismate synthase
VDKSNSTIVYYRMPNEKNIWFIQSESAPEEIDSLANISENPGFIFHPYTSDGSCKTLFIKADKLDAISIEDLCNVKTGWRIETTLSVNNYSKNKEEYCKIVEDAIKEINSGGLKKVVLSRVKSITCNAGKNPVKIFYKLCVKYPSAFVSLVYIPENVLWITASPELLISANINKIKTVSLAGTKPAESVAEWGEKEKIEQQVVTDYINDVLEKYCSNIHVSGPEDVVTANLKHLKTSFSATLNAKLWDLVAGLHPTPAVCGIPLLEAKKFINLTEGYDRKYYTGFLGPCNINNKTNLFVNLRCAELFAGVVNLYIGGGITKDSEPEMEWLETELKSKTLLFAFEDNEKE